MNDNKKQNLIIVTLIIMMVILTFNFYTGKRKLENMERQFQVVQSQMNTQYSNLSSDINLLKESMNKSMSELYSYHFSYDGIDTQKGTVKYHMTFDLKQVTSNAKYYISYSPVEENNYTEVEANSIGNMSFDCNLSLSNKYNYMFKIIEKTGDGGSKQLNNEEIFNYVYNDYFVDRIRLDGFTIGQDEKQLTYSFSFSNNTFGIKEYEVKTVEFALYFGDSIVYYEDVTDNPTNLYPSEVNNGIAGEVKIYEESDGQATAMLESTSECYNIAISLEELEHNNQQFFDEVEEFCNFLEDKITITLQNGEKIELR